MPAEWEAHEATWIAWPHERSDWPGKFAPIPWIYAEIVRYLAEVEIVRILVDTPAQQRQIARILKQSHVDTRRVEYFQYPTNRSWCRDFAPIFVTNGAQLAITNWRFNGWAKYDNWQLDDAIPSLLAKKLKLPLFTPRTNGRRIVLEGGSIDVDGEGTLLTTEECLLSPIQARNPHLSRTEIEQALADWLGIHKVLWLGNGITGDDTHGHIDDLARFTSPASVLTVVETNSDDPNFSPLQDNLTRLRAMTDAKGRTLKVGELPMPRPIWFKGQRLPASYANFYIANGLVLVPLFGDPADSRVLTTLATHFPSHQIVGIYCRDLILGLGTLHCLTQQQPQVKI